MAELYQPPTRGEKIIASLLILFVALKATALMMALGSIGEVRDATVVINLVAIINVPASMYIIVQVWRGKVWISNWNLRGVGEILLVGFFAWAFTGYDLIEGGWRR